MAKKLEKICNYKEQLRLGGRYCLSNSARFEHSFIVTNIGEFDVLVTYLDGVNGRISYEPFIIFENPLTSLEKELL